MSSKEDKETKEIFMDEFWKAFGRRLAMFVPSAKVSEFEHQRGLVGFRLDRVVQGKKGVNIETLIRICNILDLSPTWLLFGKGRPDLSSIRQPTLTAEGIIEETIDDLERLLRNHKVRPKQEIFDLLRRLANDAETTQQADLPDGPKVPTRPVKTDSRRKIRRGAKQY